MRVCARLLLFLLPGILLWTASAWAVGTQFNGGCTTFSWSPNQEPDLAGYKIYDRVAPTDPYTLKLTVNLQITSVPCSQLNFGAGQHYLSVTAFDTSGNESLHSVDLPFVIVLDNQVSDLRVTATTSTSLTVTFTEVQDGLGAPASYDVRFASPTINWGTAASVTAGTCTTPLAGVAVGASKSCTITGLGAATQFQIQLVPFRGTLGQSAVFGPLSNVATGTTGALPTGARTALIKDNFTRASLGSDWADPIGQPWVVSSNLVQPSASGPITAFSVHKGDLPKDQWCEVVITTIAGAAQLIEGCTLRSLQAFGLSYYSFVAFKNGNGSQITGKNVGVDLGNIAIEFTTVWANGDVLRGEAIGSSLCLYRNDVQIQCGTDTNLTDGYSGIWAFLNAGAATNAQLDSFKAGSFDRITLFSDTFTRSNSTGLGNGWHVNVGEPWAVASNLATPPSAGPVGSREVQTLIMPQRQWAQATITTIAGSDYLWVGPMLRYHLDDDTGYQILASVGPSAGSGFTKRLNGVFLGNPNYEFATVWANGDIIRGEADGDQLRLYRNGILVLTATDSQFNGDYVGLYGYLNSGAASNLQLSGYEAGTWTTASSSSACGCDTH